MGEGSLKVKNAKAMYRYARAFLRYLNAAEILLYMKIAAESVKKVRNLATDDTLNLSDDELVEIERYLVRYRLRENRSEVLAVLIGRLDVDLEFATRDEAKRWEELVSAVNSASLVGSWEGEVWYEDSIDDQRSLFISNDGASDRICYYRRMLEDERLCSVVPCPQSIECVFQLNHGKLVEYAMPNDQFLV